MSGKESAQGCLPKRLLGRPDEALGAPWRKLPQGGLTQARRKAKRQGDLTNSGIKPRSPAFQADPLLSEPPGECDRKRTLNKKILVMF